MSVQRWPVPLEELDARKKDNTVSGPDVVLGRTTLGAGAIEEIPCTPAGRALLDDATASDQRTTLGLGSAATHAHGDYDAAGTAAATVATHEADKTSVHGIPDTDVLQATVDALASDRVFASRVPSVATFSLLDGTGYFVYVGRVPVTCTPKYVEFYVSGTGGGAQTAEVGLFSTPAAPNKSGQTLTKI